MGDLKSFFNQFCQKQSIAPTYEFRPTGPKHRIRFLCELRIPSHKYVAVGNSTNKEDAQTNATRDFLNYLSRKGLVNLGDIPGHIDEQPTPENALQNTEKTTTRGGLLEGESPNQMGLAYRPMGSNGGDFMKNIHEQQQKQIEEAENWNMNAQIHGNWTIDNAKSRLHQFMKANKIAANYNYYSVHKRSVIATMSIFVKDLNCTITGHESGSNKKTASQLCALSIVRQLFHLEVIKPFSGTRKKDKSAVAVEPYKVNISPILRYKVQTCLQSLSINPMIPPPSQPQVVTDTPIKEEPFSLLCAPFKEDLPVDRKTVGDGVVSWSPPTMNWNAWTNCNIDEGYLATMPLEQLSAELSQNQRDRHQDEPELRNRQAITAQLPVHNAKHTVMQAIHEHPVIIIKGNTGCGKTTQICQYILDDYIASGQGAWCNVAVTQPRWISAISVAERIAYERCELIGQSVGYSVGFESMLPRPYGSILFCTVGVLLRKLEGGLRGVSHVFVDEIHERDVNSDFILVVLRDMVHTYPDLRVILMSATIDTTLFSKYFNDCPVVEIEGRTYPVSQYFLEDAIQQTNFVAPADRKRKADEEETLPTEYDEDMNKQAAFQLGNDYSDATKSVLRNMSEKEVSFELIEAILMQIKARNQPGAVLIFLPGWNLIFALMKHLQMHRLFGGPEYLILPLHSQLPREDHHKVFQSVPPNVTKVVLSTNIAETSITINDVVYVIDSCKSKLKMFTSHNNMTSYVTMWASKTNLEQRKGRAGRVREGFCYHLCTRARFKTLDEQVTPEMFRSPLHELCLCIKLLRLGSIGHFLSKPIEPPPINEVNDAVVLLNEMKCLDQNDELTALGRILARMSIEPRMGKMMVLGCIFMIGAPLATMAANSSTFTEIFIFEKGYRRLNFNQKAMAGDRCSDHVAMLSAFEMWENARAGGDTAEARFCEFMRISQPAMKVTWEAKRQLHDILTNAGFPDESLQSYGLNTIGPDATLDMVMALMCSALYPNVCCRKEKGDVLTMEGKVAFIHRTSVNCSRVGQKTFKFPFFVFGGKIRTPACKQMSMVSPLHLLLFGSRKVEWVDGVVRLDNWINFEMDPAIAAEIVALRPALEELVTKYSQQPENILEMSDLDKQIIDTIRDLCSLEAGNFEIERQPVLQPSGGFNSTPPRGRPFNRGGNFGPPPSKYGRFQHNGPPRGGFRGGNDATEVTGAEDSMVDHANDVWVIDLTN